MKTKAEFSLVSETRGTPPENEEGAGKSEGYHDQKTKDVVD